MYFVNGEAAEATRYQLLNKVLSWSVMCSSELFCYAEESCRRRPSMLGLCSFLISMGSYKYYSHTPKLALLTFRTRIKCFSCDYFSPKSPGLIQLQELFSYQFRMQFLLRKGQILDSFYLLYGCLTEQDAMRIFLLVVCLYSGVSCWDFLKIQLPLYLEAKLAKKFWS